MTPKLRRPVRGAARPRLATGGGVTLPEIRPVGDNPEPAHEIAGRVLPRTGVDRPSAQ